MPTNNRFRHQEYRSEHPTSQLEHLQLERPLGIDHDSSRRDMAEVGRLLRKAGVAAIYLVHGTFFGTDGLGFLGELARWSPDLAKTISRWQKQLVDSMANDIGNFTSEYAKTFQSMIAADGETEIPVRLFMWSSENDHLGRAEGALSFIEELSNQAFAPGSRVLVWGHSHAGSLMALATNLLSSDANEIGNFFHAARSHFRSPWTRRVDVPIWPRMQDKLLQGNVLCDLHLDLVTMGAPIRYGWDSGAYSKLLHFIYHIDCADRPPNHAPFPPTADDIIHGRRGDVVQALAVAGTNFTPPIWAWRSWVAEYRLSKIVQNGVNSHDVLSHMKQGKRAHDDGLNLLIDYRNAGKLAEPLFGHAVYTRSELLPFHAKQVADHFYAHHKESCEDGRSH